MIYRWGAGPFGLNPARAARMGQRGRVLVRGVRMRSVLVEFPGGFRMVTASRAVRRAGR